MKVSITKFIITNIESLTTLDYIRERIKFRKSFQLNLSAITNELFIADRYVNGFSTQCWYIFCSNEPFDSIDLSD